MKIQLIIHDHHLRIRWSLSAILKTSKKVYEVMFFDMKKYMFWKFIQYTVHWDKTQMLKKFPSGKIIVARNALFFYSWAPTHYSLTFNLRFLYELKHEGSLPKSVCMIFHFRFCFVFFKIQWYLRELEIAKTDLF